MDTYARVVKVESWSVSYRSRRVSKRLGVPRTLRRKYRATPKPSAPQERPPQGATLRSGHLVNGGHEAADICAMSAFPSGAHIPEC